MIKSGMPNIISKTTVTHDVIVETTKNWLDRFIIQQGLCPFAKREHDKGSIHYAVTSSNNLAQQLEDLIGSCQKLDTDSKIETLLHIYPSGLNHFDHYLDFLELANGLMHEQGYEGIYQLASFHPQYLFAAVDAKDASHFTNRSPFPILHLLREASVATAVANHPNPEDIPLRNIQYTRQLGSVALEKILASCDGRLKIG